MSITEIVLIAAGCIVLILGYLLPGRKKDEDTGIQQVSEEQIKDMVKREIDGVKGRIDDIVEETVSYSIEKTERAMERLSNEKIMSVNEYSETVLESINKNHESVVFLYDMLNEKHDGLIQTVGEASKTAKDIEQMVKNAEVTVKEVLDKLPSDKEDEAEAKLQKEKTSVAKKQTGVKKTRQTSAKKDIGEMPVPEQPDAEFSPIVPLKAEEDGARILRTPEVKKESEPRRPGVDINFNNGFSVGNNNERILELHKMGKSKTAIAKELSLGVGEVKLVIDLYESM